MRRPTRDDVARLAGTSTAVVSYVINNGPRPVAPATRQRVLEAIERLGYRPDTVAQAMASQRTNLIGLIVPDARQPYFAELAHAVERAAFARDHLVLLGNSAYDDERQLHYVRAFLGMRVSGLLLIRQGAAEPLVEEVSGSRTRLVLLHHRTDLINTDAVVADDVTMGVLAVEHLLGHGHERVACFDAPAGTPRTGNPVALRTKGWRQALRDAGIDPERGLLHRAPFDRYGAARAARRVLSRPNRPTAIFCTTDDQAIGVLHAARELGLRVPDDLAVASCDDIAEAALHHPSLTTVATDREAMAEAAVDLVLQSRQASTPEIRRFPARLVTRESCGCPPASDL
ncbi:LacI family DNA-binding transcriptional regulator [Streptoalloteichus hindustanus]|uniref:Transcriptional regulator, LacI family n=1 Tax=Streptoalloteichus hindustanus TaxID=2017 RepID=A0A1M5NAL5_STRHI|nr:LacI family DNA-binding transcriptional regulator [Streptoalloteichus hindustanus]SHG86033.1 transcriptional regulator, LacI family [Streptoalloteichus hindustanus]